MKNITVKVKNETHKKLKMFLANEEITFQDLLEKYLESLVK